MKTLTLTINKKPENYKIVLGNNFLENLTNHYDIHSYSTIVVVTDENIAVHLLENLLKKLPQETIKIILTPGEKTKTIETVQKIWTTMKNEGCDRKTLVINLGGGVITDIGGFAASTYMRGVDFINIPTTLLSQVDASVGGKTGIDFAGVKNLIGTFDQPKTVIVDVATLKTLPEREFISGFAEIIKHGLIADKLYFEKVTNKKPTEFSDEELIEIIAKSCEIKKQIIENDPSETGQRKLVNFGHTIGHAIEALSLETDKALLHGEAISIGMIAEAKISVLQNLLSENDLQTIKNSLAHAGLPTSLRDHEMAKQSPDKIIEKMQSDKKNVSGKINFTLLTEIGKAIYDQTNIAKAIIQEALAYVLP